MRISKFLYIFLALSLNYSFATAAQFKCTYKVRGKRYHVIKKSAAKKYKVRGIASWYGKGFHGKKTANGERYNMYAMTAASKVLPLGTKVKVTNLSNHKSVVVKINDRGPFYKGRIIDLSLAAARKLGFSKKGKTKVEVQTIA